MNINRVRGKNESISPTQVLVYNVAANKLSLPLISLLLSLDKSHVHFIGPHVS